VAVHFLHHFRVSAVIEGLQEKLDYFGHGHFFFAAIAKSQPNTISLDYIQVEWVFGQLAGQVAHEGV